MWDRLRHQGCNHPSVVGRRLADWLVPLNKQGNPCELWDQESLELAGSECIGGKDGSHQMPESQAKICTGVQVGLRGSFRSHSAYVVLMEKLPEDYPSAQC